MLIARKKEDCLQTLNNHASAVSKEIGKYCVSAKLYHCGMLSGLVHDFGKSNPQWQEALFRGDKKLPPHSIFGAILLDRVFGDIHENGIASQILQNAVLGHHSGLGDQVSQSETNAFCFKLNNPDFQLWQSFFDECTSMENLKDLAEHSLSEIAEVMDRAATLADELGVINPSNYFGILQSLITRYIYSCLIDADRSNAADWDKKVESVEQTGEKRWEEYYQNLCFCLSEKTLPKNASLKEQKIFAYRQKISEECDAATEKTQKICRLFVPTGGGKTLAGLRFALKYASSPERHIKRIFYIIPYTTILEQTASDIIDTIGDRDAVLQHYASYVPDENIKENHNETETLKYELAAERWNAPIVLTTQVQFLNALYAGKSQSARRMHQLSDSILIFDEVQTVPLHCQSLFDCAITMLTEFCGCIAVLCTATQPQLSNVQYAMPEPISLTSESHAIQDCFKRVSVQDLTDRKISTAEIADLTCDHANTSVLVILNTKDAVRSLYQELKSRGTPNLFHLSTSMCPAHRTKVLKKIRKKLKDHEKVICVSTNLIEAGVDISFGCVIRSLCGLDSIAQVAGRCNRHGECEGLGIVMIIDESESKITLMKDLQKAREVTRDILEVFQDDPESIEHDLFSPTAIGYYFKKLYQSIGGEVNYKIDRKDAERGGLPSIGLNMTDILGANEKLKKDVCSRYKEIEEKQYLFQSFHAAGEIFQVIRDDTVSVLVPFGKGRTYYRKILAETMKKNDFRKMTPYCVNLYYSRLKQRGNNVQCSEKYGLYMLNKAYYNKKVGIQMEGMAVEDYVV